MLSCTCCGISSDKHIDTVFISDEATGLVLCEKCIDVFGGAVKKSKVADVNTEDIKITPKELFARLNKYIVGQDAAKKAVSVAIYQHFQRLNNPNIKTKSNILIMGPTGSGKTEIPRVLSKELNIPFVVVDSTNFTPRGYVGDDVSSAVVKLLNACDGDVAMAEKGIIFLDEIDKIPDGGRSGSFKSVMVQQELLKMVEGDQMEIDIGAGHDKERVSINTSNILFIAAGSFTHMEAIKTPEKSMGIMGVVESPTKEFEFTDVKNKDLVSFGVIPELLGRFPVKTTTAPLGVDELTKIMLTSESSPLKDYIETVKGENIVLSFSDDFVADMAKEAHQLGVGARSIRQIVEDRMKDFMFNIEDYAGQTIEFTTEGIKKRKPKKTKKDGIFVF